MQKMPELLTSQYEVQFSEEEETRYKELKADFILELPKGEITAPNAASPYRKVITACQW